MLQLQPFSKNYIETELTITVVSHLVNGHVQDTKLFVDADALAIYLDLLLGTEPSIKELNPPGLPDVDGAKSTYDALGYIAVVMEWLRTRNNTAWAITISEAGITRRKGTSEIYMSEKSPIRTAKIEFTE